MAIYMVNLPKQLKISRKEKEKRINLLINKLLIGGALALRQSLSEI